MSGRSLCERVHVQLSIVAQRIATMRLMYCNMHALCSVRTSSHSPWFLVIALQPMHLDTAADPYGCKGLPTSLAARTSCTRDQSGSVGHTAMGTKRTPLPLWRPVGSMPANLYRMPLAW